MYFILGVILFLLISLVGGMFSNDKTDISVIDTPAIKAKQTKDGLDITIF